jgi:hypothetical protein
MPTRTMLAAMALAAAAGGAFVLVARRFVPGGP